MNICICGKPWGECLECAKRRIRHLESALAQAREEGRAEMREKAAAEAETHGAMCGHGFDGDAGRCIAEDIRTLTTKDGGGT